MLLTSAFRWNVFVWHSSVHCVQLLNFSNTPNLFETVSKSFRFKTIMHSTIFWASSQSEIEQMIICNSLNRIRLTESVLQWLRSNHLRILNIFLLHIYLFSWSQRSYSGSFPSSLYDFEQFETSNCFKTRLPLPVAVNVRLIKLPLAARVSLVQEARIEEEVASC